MHAMPDKVHVCLKCKILVSTAVSVCINSIHSDGAGVPKLQYTYCTVRPSQVNTFWQ